MATEKFVLAWWDVEDWFQMVRAGTCACMAASDPRRRPECRPTPLCSLGVCSAGHFLTEDNVYVRLGEHKRSCRTCKNAYNREWYRARRQRLEVAA